VLKVLRESSGYTIEEVAKKLNINVEKIKATEEGLASFTLTQIKKLASIYHRSLAAFFSDMIPTMPKIPDYRINRDKRLTPGVYISERRAYYLAKKLSEITKIKSQIPTFPETLKPEELSYQFRKYLGIDLLKSTQPPELLDYYKQILEEKLFISIIELPLKADDVRGFSIFSDVSMIVLNENDRYSVKLFSLFHEVFHLLKRTSGICSIEIEQRGENIETECNLFSAEFLVPLDDLKRECKYFTTLDKDSITELYNIYGVSKQVIMLRLLRTGFIICRKIYR
jgi:Zn-dependent peptidase ImmA (M78 family)/DNA-binding XRE family transcriptional regulator